MHAIFAFIYAISANHFRKVETDMDPKGKSPMLEIQIDDSSSSWVEIPKVEDNFQELETLVDLPDLNSKTKFGSRS